MTDRITGKCFSAHNKSRQARFIGVAARRFAGINLPPEFIMRRTHIFFAAGAVVILLLSLVLLMRIMSHLSRMLPQPTPAMVAPAMHPETSELLAQAQADLKKLPAEYKIGPYSQAAADLLALPRNEAVDLLKYFAVTKDSAKTKYLCLLLFELTDVPDSGHPFAGHTLVAYLDDIPFILVRPDGSNAQKLSDGRTFLNFCLTKAKWTTRHYAPVTPEQLRTTLDKLLALNIWAVPFTDEDKMHLYDEADLLPKI